MSIGEAIQAGIYNTLTNYAPLMAVVSGVFDNVPDSYDQFPYVTIGEDVAVEYDTDDTKGFAVTIVIHSWSRYKGRLETKQIQGFIYDALHKNDISIGPDYSGILLLVDSMDSFLDPDGITRHGTIQFRLLAKEST